MKAFADRRYAAWAGAFVVLKLWLVAAQPVLAVGGSWYDDHLFLQLAEHLIRGEWLGNYSQMTLMKGPMFSLWIAGTFLLGVPLPLANHLLYLTACWMVIRAVRPLLPHDGAAFALFALLCWNPMSYEAQVLTRVLRQNFYTPAALLVFASLIALETRRRAALPVRLAWGALGGSALAAVWLTREESIWILPSVVLLVAAAAWNSWRTGERLRSLAAPLAIGVASGAAILVTVCALNYRHYGWFGTNEFRSPQFLAAFGALQRVAVAPAIPGVTVRRATREACYRVSPAFRELQPLLEGPFGSGWADLTRQFTGLPPSELEIAGGWFMWALRDAVARAGYGDSAQEALAYYQRVADEINRACDAGELPARPRRDSMMPPLQPGDVGRFVRTLPGFFDYFATFRGFVVISPPSVGSAEHLQIFRELTRWRLAPSPAAPQLDVPLQQRADAYRLALLRWIGKAFRWIGAAALFGGFAGWIYLAARLLINRRASYVFFLATSLLGAAVAVVLINALVHVLSFPNLSPGAFAQAYPLALLFGGLVWIECGRQILRTRLAQGS